MGVDPRIAAATALVPGGAGRRLSAKIIDGVLPAILFGVAAGIGASLITVTQVGDFAQVNFTWLLILLSIASVLSLAYGIWLWLWEAKSGKTPGNLMVGLRTTNMEGHPAGVLAIFLRNLIVFVSSIVPTIGPLLVTISNAWDANDKKQGWHDKVAHTLVFNIKTGRDPLETGGIAERADFIPPAVPTISEVRSPLSRPTEGGPPHSGTTQAAQWQDGSTQGGPAQAEAGMTAAAPASPPSRGGRRKRKSAADPFVPAAVHFHGQPGQPGQFGQTGQPGQSVPAQTFPTQPLPDEAGQPTPAGQPFPPQPVQPGNPFAPPSSTQAGGSHAGGPQTGSLQAGSLQTGSLQAGNQQAQFPVDQGPITAVPGFSRPAQPNPAQPNPAQSQPYSQQFQQAQPPAAQRSNQQPTPQAAHDDDAVGETRIRPVSVQSALRLSFDDGCVEDVGTVALIGRNPAGYDGEMISRLISVKDSSRSVSKTHLHVRISAEGLWVTDRNSTNGSSLSNANGTETALVGGTPALAAIGSRVHFGDRSFVVGHP